jgi:hypothetical protein
MYNRILLETSDRLKKSEMEVIGKVYMRVGDLTDHFESHKYDADYFEQILQCLVGASGCERNWVV